jgi:hypothetical protein
MGSLKKLIRRPIGLKFYFSFNQKLAAPKAFTFGAD